MAAMEQETIEAGMWIITEGGSPGSFIYKLNKGKVSIWTHGERIRTIEVESLADSVFLGVIAALRKDRMNIASVLTETEVEVEKISIDQVWGVLNNETTAELRNKIDTMIEAIYLSNEIESLKRRLASLPLVNIDPPDDLRIEGKVMLDEIQRLYNSVM